MPESNIKKDVRDDEIDLLDLLRRIRKSFSQLGKVLGRAFLYTLVFLIKKWLPLGLSVLIGVGVSYFLKMSSRSTYTSEMLLRNNNADLELIKKPEDPSFKNNTIMNSDLISYINRLNYYCRENNRTSLADAISISLEQSKNISDINAHWIIDKGNDGNPDYIDYNDNHNIYDTVNVRMPDRIAIRIKINSTQELSTIRNGILTYINKDSLFQQRNRIRLNQLNTLISRLNIDIQQLDSLQKVKYFEETRNNLAKGGGQMVFMQEQRTQLLYNDIFTLYKRKQNLESEGALYKDIVTVLSDFSLPSRRENGALFYGTVVIPVFFCLTLIILLILANRKKLKEVFNKY